MRVADFIANTLVEHGITTMFSVTGGGAMHLNNAFSICKGLTVYYNHHEQACAMAAEGYARVNGKMAAVCVTSGPGGTNAITGVMGAFQDNIPILIISGQVRYDTTIEGLGLPVRQYGEQEFDIVNSVRNMTKYVVMIKDPATVKYHLEKALHLAGTGRRGPCWIDVPLNVQSAQVDHNSMAGYNPQDEARPYPPLDFSLVNKVIEKIKQAKRPLVLAGTGIRASNSCEHFRRFAFSMGVPVVTAQASPDSMYEEHPLYFGPSGTAASRSGNFILQNCDVLLVLGCRLGFKQTGFNYQAFAPNAYRIMVDVDTVELKKPTIHIDFPVHAELGEFINAAIPIAQNYKGFVPEKWLLYCRRLREKYPVYQEKSAHDSERVHSYYFTHVYNEIIPDEYITALGNSGSAIAPVYQMGTRKPGQRILVNTNCGAMGDDLPLAIGACVAACKKPITLITGDGSVHMNIQELQTIVHNKLPIKVIVYNNGGYRSIYQTHMNFFKGQIAGCTPESGLSLPDFEKIARKEGFKDVADSFKEIA